MNRLASSIAAAALALAATPAAAQSAPEVEALTFQGSAPGGCLIRAPQATATDNATVSGLAAGSADIAISQMVDEEGASLGATVTLALPAICNQSHTLTLTSQNGALVNIDGGAAGGPFRNSVPYTMIVSWGAETQSASSASGLTLSYGDAAAGDVTLTIQIPDGGDPLVAGAYADQLILELGAAG